MSFLHDLGFVTAIQAILLSVLMVISIRIALIWRQAYRRRGRGELVYLQLAFVVLAVRAATGCVCVLFSWTHLPFYDVCTATLDVAFVGLVALPFYRYKQIMRPGEAE